MPAEASQLFGFDSEGTNCELDAMPVVECYLTNHLRVRLLAHVPSEIRRPLYREASVMGAVGEIERKDSSSG